MRDCTDLSNQKVILKQILSSLYNYFLILRKGHKCDILESKQFSCKRTNLTLGSLTHLFPVSSNVLRAHTENNLFYGSLTSLYVNLEFSHFNVVNAYAPTLHVRVALSLSPQEALHGCNSGASVGSRRNNQ